MRITITLTPKGAADLTRLSQQNPLIPKATLLRSYAEERMASLPVLTRGQRLDQHLREFSVPGAVTNHCTTCPGTYLTPPYAHCLTCQPADAWDDFLAYQAPRCDEAKPPELDRLNTVCSPVEAPPPPCARCHADGYLECQCLGIGSLNGAGRGNPFGEDD